MAEPFTVKFWGARGSMSSSHTHHDRYGGNTACLEVKCGDQILIFDAGSGLRFLGNQLMNEGHGKLHLFFTHCHYDHISGIPFFAPFFSPKSEIDIWSGHLPGPNKTEQMLYDYMRPPFFPVGPEVFSAQINYRDFEPTDVLHPTSDIKVETLSLNHHDGCVGYRVNYSGRSMCYITDMAHVPGIVDEALIEFVRETDLMVYDSTYSDEEFEQFANFGHSTWEEGIRLSKRASVKRFCAFHHRPSRTDEVLDQIAADAKKQFRRSIIAREGLTVRL